jgi:hypothetical protein
MVRCRFCGYEHHLDEIVEKLIVEGIGLKATCGAGGPVNYAADAGKAASVRTLLWASGEIVREKTERRGVLTDCFPRIGFVIEHGDQEMTWFVYVCALMVTVSG